MKKKYTSWKLKELSLEIFNKKKLRRFNIYLTNY